MGGNNETYFAPYRQESTVAYSGKSFIWDDTNWDFHFAILHHALITKPYRLLCHIVSSDYCGKGWILYGLAHITEEKKISKLETPLSVRRHPSFHSVWFLFFNALTERERECEWWYYRGHSVPWGRLITRCWSGEELPGKESEGGERATAWTPAKSLMSVCLLHGALLTNA